jgi:hypothetical protein
MGVIHDARKEVKDVNSKERNIERDASNEKGKSKQKFNIHTSKRIICSSNANENAEILS